MLLCGVALCWFSFCLLLLCSSFNERICVVLLGCFMVLCVALCYCCVCVGSNCVVCVVVVCFVVFVLCLVWIGVGVMCGCPVLCCDVM